LNFRSIWAAEGWPYVSAVIDLFLCGVVGWSMSASMTAYGNVWDNAAMKRFFSSPKTERATRTKAASSLE